jgi:hypothetical protein
MQAATAASHISFLHASPVGEAWLGAARWQAKAQNKAAGLTIEAYLRDFIFILCRNGLRCWEQVLGDDIGAQARDGIRS